MPTTAHRFTLAQRHALHIVATHYPDSTWHNRARIFNHVFSTDVDGARLGREYSNRLAGRESSVSAVRSSQWASDVARDEFRLPGPFDAQQHADRRRALANIQAVIVVLEMVRERGLGRITLVLDAEHAALLSGIALPPPTMPNAAAADSITSSFIHSAPAPTFPSQAASGPAAPPMEMYHYSDIYSGIPPNGHVRDDTTYGSHYEDEGSRLIDQRDVVYQLGGFVHRIAIDGDESHERDVMLCNIQYCERCCPTGLKRLAVPGRSRTEGLPFVHSRDLEEAGGTSTVLDYAPKLARYSHVLPEQVATRRVRFADGGIKEVASCRAKCCAARQ